MVRFPLYVTSCGREFSLLGQADADHGIKDGCGIKALGSYPEIRAIWVNHLKEQWDADAWENGEGYQPEV